MKKLLLSFALLSGGWARAQTACPPPQLKAFHQEQQVKTTGSALPPSITLTLTSDPACPSAATYQVKKAEMTLIRGRRPILPARNTQGAEVDLSDFAKFARPGDRLYIEVLEAAATPAGGSPQPYQPAEGSSIALNWVVTK